MVPPVATDIVDGCGCHKYYNQLLALVVSGAAGELFIRRLRKKNPIYKKLRGSALFGSIDWKTVFGEILECVDEDDNIEDKSELDITKIFDTTTLITADISVGSVKRVDLPVVSAMYIIGLFHSHSLCESNDIGDIGLNNPNCTYLTKPDYLPEMVGRLVDYHNNYLKKVPAYNGSMAGPDGMNSTVKGLLEKTNSLLTKLGIDPAILDPRSDNPDKIGMADLLEAMKHGSTPMTGSKLDKLLGSSTSKINDMDGVSKTALISDVMGMVSELPNLMSSLSGKQGGAPNIPGVPSSGEMSKLFEKVMSKPAGV